ncbi:glycoside hydrolase family 55 protein [Paenibacillus sp. N4]|uniref:glycoside hydrolase family 55 protein n=1 Tax=Paenibacillus vietnamensis TaxID=2590547 RepID=UPI001CD09693|nr:glycoside hydrolase family 55 protein [Paenibacillus vietnamensis]MCA0755707.1 glycoside hydrolase family 55 protein [Paenibacillus vietnamensis]
MINAKTDFGAKGDGIADDTQSLQAAMNEAGRSGKVLYVPKGSYKHSATLVAGANDFRMFGDGTPTVFKPTYSNADGIVFGLSTNTPQSGSGSKPSGWAKDFAVIGPAPKPNTNSAGIKLNGIRQFRVENTNVTNFDIGYDLVNNCFGSSFHNIRAVWTGLNVGINLRTGLQSGNDIQFYNVWVGGEKAAVHISGFCGGFQFWGGQFGNTQRTAASTGIPVDERGVVIIGKDYVTGELGGVANVTIEGVDIEGFQEAWVIRTFSPVDISLRGLGINSYDQTRPGIGVLKMENAGPSTVSLIRVPVIGKFSGDRLIEIESHQSGFSIHEFGCRYRAAIGGGTTQDGGSLLVQSRIPNGQAIFRDQGYSKQLLDDVLIRRNQTTKELEISPDWGASWTLINTRKPVYYKSQASPVIGTGGSYGAVSVMRPYTNFNIIDAERFQIMAEGSFAASETVTVKVGFIWSDNVEMTLEKKMTAAGTIWLGDEDFAALSRGDQNVVRLCVYAKTTAAATGVSVTAYGFGYNRV